MSSSSPPMKDICSQHNLLLVTVDFDLDHWVKVMFVSSLHDRVALLPTSHGVLLGSYHTQSSLREWRVIFYFPAVGSIYINNLEFYIVELSVLFHLKIYLVIYSYQFRLIFFYTLGYNRRYYFNIFLEFFQIWLLVLFNMASVSL